MYITLNEITNGYIVKTYGYQASEEFYETLNEALEVLNTKAREAKPCESF